MPVANPFSGELAARRYAAGRLDVHAEFVRRILWGLGGRRFESALDIGCGTGLSTRPLAAACRVAVGIDLSAPMLREARRRAPSRLVLGRGEQLPFPAGSFDLVTMGSAFHWCEPGPLAAGIRRVLAPEGCLAVFDHFLTGRMEGEPRFAAWFEAYRKRFPAPPRHPDFEATRDEGFLPVARERFEHEVPLSLDALVAYVTSQSSVLAAVGAGLFVGEADALVRADLEPLFRDRGTAAVVYRGELDVLRRR